MLIHSATYPAHLILMDLLNVTDTLQDVGDVIDPSFLNSEFAGGFVDVEHEIVPAFNKSDEAFCKQR
jgi:hypothetical protein